MGFRAMEEKSFTNDEVAIAWSVNVECDVAIKADPAVALATIRRVSQEIIAPKAEAHIQGTSCMRSDSFM